MYVKAGIDDSARGPAWGQAQLDDYMAHRYRQPSDKYSADWDVRGALEDLRAVLRGGLSPGAHAAFSALVSQQRISRKPSPQFGSGAGGGSRRCALRPTPSRPMSP